MSKSLSQLTARTDNEDADIYLMRRGSVDYKQTHDTLFDPLRYSENVTAYNAGTSYKASNPPSVRYALYNDIIWECLSVNPISGVAPDSDPTKWRKVYAAKLAHFINEDIALAQGSADEVTAADIRLYLDKYQTVSLALSAADVKTLNSVPVEIVAAPGAGYAIEFISASAFLDWGSVAFDNTAILLQTDTAGTHQAATGTLLTATADKFVRFSTSSGGATTQIVENKALQVTAAADSTTTGDSPVTIYLNYRIITL